MKKRWLAVLLTGVMAASVLAGCGSTDKGSGGDSSEAASEGSAAADESAAGESAGAEDSAAGESAAEEGAAAVKYVYSNDDVDLAPYMGLSAEYTYYTVTSAEIDDMILATLEEYAEYIEQDRGAEVGDDLILSMVGLADGEEALNFTYSENEEEDYSYEMVLGNGEFGAELDEKLTGAKKGDKLAFSIAYPEDDEYFPGMTIDYDIEVIAVREISLPEYNDEFVKANTDAETTEEYEQFLMEDMQAEYDSQSLTAVYDELLAQVTKNSELKQYDEEEYQAILANFVESYEYYAEMFGYEYEDMLEAFGVTEESLEQDAMDQLKEDRVIQAIAENEGIELTEEQLKTSVSEMCADYGYESAEEMIEDYGEEELKGYVLKQMVQELLYNNAEITEVEGDIGETIEY